jgi:uncharacterized protein YjbJ (UPF0337 family)
MHAPACRKPLKPRRKRLGTGLAEEGPNRRVRAPDDSTIRRSEQMNWDRIEGNWKQLKGKAKQQWGKLTDDQLDVIAGSRDELAGKIQEEYGITKDEAEKQLTDFETRYRDWTPKN